MKVQELDDLLYDEKNMLMTKQIKRGINKKIYHKTIITIIIFCLVIAGGYFATGFMLDYVNYDPHKEKETTLDEDINLLLDTYVQMEYPGVFFINGGYDNDSNIKSLGFGKYEIPGKFVSGFEQLGIDNSDKDAFVIDKSTMSIRDTSRLCLNFVYEFKDPQLTEEDYIYNSVEEMISEITKMPDSAYLDVSLSFEQSLSLEQLASLINQYPQVNFNWGALDDQASGKIYGVSGGMSLSDVTRYDLKTNKYPDLYLDTINSETLRNHYLSQLQLLIDHPDFTKMISIMTDRKYSLNNLKERYQKASKSMTFHGVRVYLDKQDLLEIAKNNVSTLQINDVKLSKYQK